LAPHGLGITLGVGDQLLHGKARCSRIARFNRLEYSFMHRHRLPVTAGRIAHKPKIDAEGGADDMRHTGEKAISRSCDDRLMEKQIRPCNAITLVASRLHSTISVAHSFEFVGLCVLGS
jgi:hypothetical protein